METRALDSALAKTAAANYTAEEKQPTEQTKKAEIAYKSAEVDLKKKYAAVSKNGDTLELSEAGKRLGVREKLDVSQFSGELVASSKKIADTTLAGYSDAKLRQMYAGKKITKQQYERIIKKRSAAK